MKDGYIVQEGTAEEILTNPANEYVARFIENVNISKVITAESIMRKPEEVAILDHDGPRTALRKMTKAGISKIFVVKRNWELEGIVTAKDAVNAVEKNEKDISGILQRDIASVSTDTTASELFPLLAEINYPVAVTDDRKSLLGIVVKSSLLSRLAEGVQGNEFVEDSDRKNN
jgi:glycine betaine/proline transport system ATP-binding protein